MTPLQLAQAECCNWRPPEGCLGVGIKQVGLEFKLVRLWPARPDCILADPKARCPFFEECIMPRKIDPKWPNRQAEFAEAVHAYRMATGAMTAAKRSCPGCGKGMEPRKRYCPECATARRKATIREAVRNHRKAGSDVNS